MNKEKTLREFVDGFIKILKSFPEGDIYTVNPIILELQVYLDKYIASQVKETK